MRRIFIIVYTIILMSFSCCENDIRILSLSHEEIGPINRLLTTFLEYNYRYPLDLVELCSFVFECPDIDADTYVQSGRKEDIVNYLSSKKNRYISYGDSCFFYSKTTDTGCCEYGNPTEIINHPWDFRHNEFHPMLKTEHGLFWGECDRIESILDESLFGRDLISVSLMYYPAKGRWHNSFFDERSISTVFLRVLFMATGDGDVQVYSSPQALKKILSPNEDLNSLLIQANQFGDELDGKFSVFFDSIPDLCYIIFPAFLPVK